MGKNFVVVIASMEKREKMSVYKFLSWNDFLNFGMQSTLTRRHLHNKFDLV